MLHGCAMQMALHVINCLAQCVLKVILVDDFIIGQDPEDVLIKKSFRAIPLKYTQGR
jgi:hypothetical protein